MLEMQLPDGRLDILCVGAHPDDIEIGCGGTLLTLRESRDVRITVAILTGSKERSDEAVAAAKRFAGSGEVRFGGLTDGRLPAAWGETKTFLEDLSQDVSPSIIFAPRRDDAHQDHRLIGELVPTVWRDSVVFGYEIPKWDGDLAPVTHYVPLRPDIARRKFALLDEVYPSQRVRDWWDQEVFLGLMRLRGMESRTQYAEGFVSAKTILDFRVRAEGRTI